MIALDKLHKMLRVETAASKWWTSLTTREKKAYLAAHPSSKFKDGPGEPDRAPTMNASQARAHKDIKRGGGLYKLKKHPGSRHLYNLNYTGNTNKAVGDFHRHLTGLGYKKVGQTHDDQEDTRTRLYVHPDRPDHHIRTVHDGPNLYIHNFGRNVSSSSKGDDEKSTTRKRRRGPSPLETAYLY